MTTKGPDPQLEQQRPIITPNSTVEYNTCHNSGWTDLNYIEYNCEKKREEKNLEIPFEPKQTPNISNPFSFFTPRSSSKAIARRVQTERPDGRSEREGTNGMREEKNSQTP
jgi:hypothetical protein